MEEVSAAAGEESIVGGLLPEVGPEFYRLAMGVDVE